jgi:hypothetical protein
MQMIGLEHDFILPEVTKCKDCAFSARDAQQAAHHLLERMGVFS